MQRVSGYTTRSGKRVRSYTRGAPVGTLTLRHTGIRLKRGRPKNPYSLAKLTDLRHSRSKGPGTTRVAYGGHHPPASLFDFFVGRRGGKRRGPSVIRHQSFAEAQAAMAAA